MKITSIGLIPKDWEVKSVKECTDIVTGATPSTEIKDYWGGDIPWMSSGELNDKFIHSVSGRITQNGYDHSGTHMIPKECVLIGLAGQGKTRGTAAFNLIPLCTNQSIAAILPKDEFNSLFLYYWLDSQYNNLRQLSAGDGGRGGLNKQILLKIEFPFPQIEEQKRIADALSSIDVLITGLDEAIEKKRQIKEGLMQNLLTGRRRLSEKEGWKESTLGQLADICKGVQFDSSLFTEGGKYPMLNGGIIPSGYSDYYNTEAETITISEGGNSCGYVNYMTVKFWCGGHCYSLKVKGLMDKMFLYQLLKFNEKAIMALRVGSGLPNVQGKALSDFSLKYPLSIEEQRAISEILNKADQEILSLESQRDKYILIKQGMMHELLTGKTRLI